MCVALIGPCVCILNHRAVLRYGRPAVALRVMLLRIGLLRDGVVRRLQRWWRCILRRNRLEGIRAAIGAALRKVRHRGTRDGVLPIGSLMRRHSRRQSSDRYSLERT